MRAEQLIARLMLGTELIDQYLAEIWSKPPKGFIQKPFATVTKSKFLSGSEVASLKPKQHVVIGGRRGVVLDVNIKETEIELIYAKGVKNFSRDKILTVRKTDSKIPVQYFTKTYTAEDLITEKLTKGMKNAYSRRENAARVCPDCGLAAPSYPGRYPRTCPFCDGEMEACKKSKRSEQSDYHKMYGSQMRVVSNKTRIGGE